MEFSQDQQRAWGRAAALLRAAAVDIAAGEILPGAIGPQPTLPNLRIDPDVEDVHVTGVTFRAPQALPVVFG
jgi:hypothetical protein